MSEPDMTNEAQQSESGPQDPGALTRDSLEWMAFEALMREYTSLKSEQERRIGFRDNLLYVTMVAVGAVFAFNASTENYSHSLLVIPWITLILGWTYLVNDRHISLLGQYFREEMTVRFRKRFPGMLEEVFEWEPFHRSDPGREFRKSGQLVVDLITFCLPSFVSLLVYTQVSSSFNPWLMALAIVEGVMSLALAITIFWYADFHGSRKS